MSVPAMIQALEPRRVLSGVSASPDFYMMTHDQPLTVDVANGVLSNDSGWTDSGDPPEFTGTLTSSVTTDPAHGSLSLNSDGSFGYTPTAGYVGLDSFAYNASFGTETMEATVTVEVVNYPPCAFEINTTFMVAVNDVLEVMEPVADAVDPENDDFCVTLGADVQHGTLELYSDSTFKYTPETDYFGPDSFSVKYVDIHGEESHEIVVNISVIPNHPPDVAISGTSQVSAGSAPTRLVIANGTITDDGVKYDRYRVEWDDNGDGDAEGESATQEAGEVIQLLGEFPLGTHSVRIRAVEYDALGNRQQAGAWRDCTFEVTNQEPAFENETEVKLLDPDIPDPYVLYAATDPDGDWLTYALSDVPGVEFTENSYGGAPSIRVVDARAFRAAIASGATYTLTVTDPFGDSDTLEISFRNIVGSIVTAEMRETAKLVESTSYADGTSTVGVTDIAKSTLVFSAETKSSLSGQTIFDQPTIVANLISSVFSVPGHPDWSVELFGTPTITQTLGMSADGTTQSITVDFSRTIRVLEGANVVYVMTFGGSMTIFADGTVGSQYVSQSGGAMAAYNPISTGKYVWTGFYWSWVPGTTFLSSAVQLDP